MSIRDVRTYAGIAVMPARIAMTAGRGAAAGFRRRRAAERRRLAVAGQVEQVLPFGVVELQRTGHRLQHRLRRTRQSCRAPAGRSSRR